MSDTAAEKELRRLTAIIKLHQSIGASLELEKICRISVRELVNALGCDACAIMLIEREKVEILARKSLLGKEDFSSDASAIRHLADTKQDIFSGDVMNSPAASYIPHGWPINSLICTPIIVNDEAKGIIHLSFSAKNAFDQEDVELVRLLAKEISTAFERSFIHSEALDLSITDALTGCFNRRKFDIDIVAEVASAKRDETPLSLLMLDVDWFKEYNDFHGHVKGDELLQKIVATLTSNVRPLDKIYRYGGEEFAIIFSETNRENASLVARRLCNAIGSEQFEGETESQPNKKITVSIGVASFSVSTNNAGELIKAADTVLYRAKQHGRNRICVLNDSP